MLLKMFPGLVLAKLRVGVNDKDSEDTLDDAVMRVTLRFSQRSKRRQSQSRRRLAANGFLQQCLERPFGDNPH